MSGLGTSGSHLYFLRMMWFCSLLQDALEQFADKCEAAGIKSAIPNLSRGSQLEKSGMF